ncbi:MAG: YceI family protein [Verrucomicrobiales bacterium]|nr:YceI family protein [Verrucomicrobiales bacterium]
MRTITASELNENPGPVVVDVRLADDFEHSHIPGAISNCVFEVAFCDRFREATPDQGTACVLYGADAESHEAKMAAEKLEEMGYGDVRVIEGGLAEWKGAGLNVDGGAPEPSDPEIPSGTLPLDLSESRVEWTGRNLLNKHFGTIGLRSGEIEVADGKLVGGVVVIDMNAIECTDLDGEMRDGLIGHLKSHDFFHTSEFPEATFRIFSSDRIEKAKPGDQNLIVRADLEMKGKTSAVELGCVAGITPEGKLAAQASFLIDRTVWNVIYGSGKFFNRLAGHLVNDLVDIEIKVITAG